MRLADGPRMLFDGVDLALEPGVRACLVGRNGAGKSTLLRILAGQAQPDGGERFAHAGDRAWSLRGPGAGGHRRDPAGLRHRRRRRGARGRGRAGCLRPRPRPLDHGPFRRRDRRRAALARAFAEQPDVLLLDEPTNHLDIFAIETLEAVLRPAAPPP